ncbi:MAG: hypothetical protein Q8K93_26180 [Reyranella sp.]|uniref:hypothetical protein n=1 Tax=Reyranella sp. TaxID=1929291 RepID=UPI00272EFEFF|nr:hypothetical protein [Reyranella sp.]MDP1965683.1 hypothetical protein [Reyranella sp.]MDP2373485.1 hypothetical protein [Reyranella sp.]
MPLDPTRLSPHELLILQALARGQRPTVTSKHRTRYELLGLVRDGPAGLQLTAEGLRRTQEMAATVVELEKAPPVREQRPPARDAMGRRKRRRHTQPV